MPGLPFAIERRGYGHRLTVATAMRWALRFGLDPSRAWAGLVRGRFLRRNLLYSPGGELLFDQVGELKASQVRAKIAEHLAD